MSSARSSKTNRIRQAAGWFKGKLSDLSHTHTPPSIDVDSSPNNHISHFPVPVVALDNAVIPTTAAASSQLRAPSSFLADSTDDHKTHFQVPVVALDNAVIPATVAASSQLRIPSSIDADSTDNYKTHPPVPVVALDNAVTPAAVVASTEVPGMSPPNSVLDSASHFGSINGPRLEIPPTDMSSTTQSPISFFQDAQNSYLHHPIIIAANNVQNMIRVNASGNERMIPQILSVLSEKLLPRAQFAEYDAASPAPRNACTENTRKAILDTLQVWASDNTAKKVYWLNGMAGTGKTTIAYSFSEILHRKKSLGGTFFASHLRADTSDVHCIIPTIALQLVANGYLLPSLPHLILDAVEANPDCKSWRIAKQFQNFIVEPLSTACRYPMEAVVLPVIVLDALDECSDQSLVAELLSVILKHSKSLPVKFFITSRPEIRPKESFDISNAHSYFILHEVEKEIVRADIELYSDSKNRYNV